MKNEIKTLVFCKIKVSTFAKKVPRLRMDGENLSLAVARRLLVINKNLFACCDFNSGV
jgi:hypothetical protein